MNFTESSMRQMKLEAWYDENCVDQHTAAKMIGIDVRTLRRWDHKGIGPKRLIRSDRKKPILYSRVEVEQFAAIYNSKSPISTQPFANGHLEVDQLQTAANGHLKADHEHSTANGHLKADHEHSTANGHLETHHEQSSANGHSTIE
jgi:hypothetical protein